MNLEKTSFIGFNSFLPNGILNWLSIFVKLMDKSNFSFMNCFAFFWDSLFGDFTNQAFGSFKANE